MRYSVTNEELVRELENRGFDVKLTARNTASAHSDTTLISLYYSVDIENMCWAMDEQHAGAVHKMTQVKDVLSEMDRRGLYKNVGHQ